MIGLQLEWMMTTIIKKNKNFRLESVNTVLLIFQSYMLTLFSRTLPELAHLLSWV
jgi:hypothetical protein